MRINIKVALVFFLTFASGSSIFAQHTQDEIYARGKWTLITYSKDNDLQYDQASLKRVGDMLYTYITIVNNKGTRFGPGETEIDCRTNEILWKAGTSERKQYPEVSLMGGAARKLCGFALSNDPSTNYQFISMMGDGVQKTSNYWAPAKVRKEMEGGNVLLIPAFASIVFPPNKEDPNHFLIAMDCKIRKVRFSKYGKLEDIKFTDDIPWNDIGETDFLYKIALFNATCGNPNFVPLPPQTESVTPGTVSTTASEKKDGTSQSKFSMQEAKEKCLDLGFKLATDGFGKCVLQLSK